MDQYVNSSFSFQLPTLQLVIDQTSLGEFKLCPRRYWYRVVLGYVPRETSYHLTFGLLMHKAREDYEHAKAKGADHEEALRIAFRNALHATWNKETGKPWDSGDHKRKKTRLTLLRTIVWYLDTYGKDDTAKTRILKNGKPAVELSFKFIPKDFYNGREFTALTGEPIFFAGHFDRLADFQGAYYICDTKTTGMNYLGDSYFSQFSPDNQVSFYTYAGKWGLQEEVTGVLIDAIQLQVTGSKFERREIPRKNPELVEWLEDTRTWINLMGIYAESDRWPMNDKSCGYMGGCPYRDLCSRSPGARKSWMEAAYVKSPWDPAVARSE